MKSLLPLVSVNRLLCGILLVHGCLLLWLGYRQSPTVDEPAHLCAGIRIWDQGRFDLYSVNPPLVKVWATGLVYLNAPHLDWARVSTRPGERTEWVVGDDFVRANLAHFSWLVTLSRWSLIPFCLAGCYCCFVWSTSLFGKHAGLLASVLWCFSPTFLAYGSLITPDCSAASCGVVAGYRFRQWIHSPTPWNTIFAGAALGAALLTKFTLLPFIILWPALWLATRHSLSDRSANYLTTLFRLVFVLLLAFIVLNVSYLCRGTFDRLGDYVFVSDFLGGGPDQPVTNRFSKSIFRAVPTPLPCDFLSGLDLQLRDFEHRRYSYLLGEWKLGGWWYYYIVAVLLKEPVGFISLVFASWFIIPWCLSCRKMRAEMLLLLAPAICIFVAVSSQLAFNKYLRYVLPAYPFAIIWASQMGRIALQSGLQLSAIVGALTVWGIASSVVALPYSHSYFNEIAGPRLDGVPSLLDANIDWGQDLYEMRDWINAHPEARPLTILVMPRIDLELLGINYPQTPGQTRSEGSLSFTPPEGWHIVSQNYLHHPTRALDYLRERKPVDRIGKSLVVYSISDK